MALSARVTGIWADQFAAPARQNYLIKGVLPRGALAQIWGAPSSGKTAVAIDIAARLAAGMEWRGRRVERCPVMYLGLENPASIEARFIAWAKVNGVSLADLPVLLARADLDFGARKDVAEFEQFMRSMSEPNGSIGCLVVDTQSRMLRTDENSFEAASALIRAFETFRQGSGATVLSIHHSGKNTDAGARGHSAVFGALDTAFEVADRRLIVRKSRDGEAGQCFAFKLVPTQIAVDQDGEAISAVVAQEAPDTLTLPAVKSDAAAVALSVLRRLAVPGDRVAVSAWREGFMRTRADDVPDTSRKAWTRSVEYLIRRALVTVDGGSAWATVTKPDSPGQDTMQLAGTDRTPPLRGVLAVQASGVQ